MKSFFTDHWPKIVLAILIIGLTIAILNRKSIFQSKITQSKMEIFKGLRDQDMERVKGAIDTLKKVTTDQK